MRQTRNRLGLAISTAALSFAFAVVYFASPVFRPAVASEGSPEPSRPTRPDSNFDTPEIGRLDVAQKGPQFDPAAQPTTISAGLGLNDWEQSKLAMARSAIDLATAAGTRRIAWNEGETGRPFNSEDDADKLERLRSAEAHEPNLIELLRKQHFGEEVSQ